MSIIYIQVSKWHIGCKPTVAMLKKTSDLIMKTNSCYGILTLTMVVVLSACQADKAETHAEDGLNQDKTKQRQADPSQVNPVKDNIKNENPVNDKQKIQVSKRSENATTAQLKEANDILEDIMKTLQATEKVVKDESLRAGLSPIRANMKFIKDELSRAGLTIIDLRLALNRYYQICMGTKPVLDRLRNQAETDIQARALYTRINRLFEYAYKL